MIYPRREMHTICPNRHYGLAIKRKSHRKFNFSKSLLKKLNNCLKIQNKRYKRVLQIIYDNDDSPQLWCTYGGEGGGVWRNLSG